MLNLVVLLQAALLAAVVMGRSEGRLLKAGIALLFFLPFTAVDYIHPGVVVMVIGAAVFAGSQAARGSRRKRPSKIHASSQNNWQAVLRMVTYCACGALVIGVALTLRRVGGSSLVFTVGVIGGPAMVAAAVASAGSRIGASAVAALLVRIAVLEGILATAQYATGSAILPASLDPAIMDGRAAGTLNGPLILAFMLVSCAPLVVALKQRRYSLASLAIIFAGIVATGSRSCLVAMAIVTLFVLARLFKRPAELLMSGALVSAIGAELLLSPLGEHVVGRFSDDRGSSATREIASHYFDLVLMGRVVSGTGLGSSYYIADALGLYSSFESAPLMFVVDIGLLGTIGLYSVLICLAFQGSADPSERHIALGLIVLVVLSIGSSSLDSITVLPYVVGLLAGLLWSAGLRVCETNAEIGEHEEPVVSAIR